MLTLSYNPSTLPASYLVGRMLYECKAQSQRQFSFEIVKPREPSELSVKASVIIDVATYKSGGLPARVLVKEQSLLKVQSIVFNSLLCPSTPSSRALLPSNALFPRRGKTEVPQYPVLFMNQPPENQGPSLPLGSESDCDHRVLTDAVNLMYPPLLQHDANHVVESVQESMRRDQPGFLSEEIVREPTPEHDIITSFNNNVVVAVGENMSSDVHNSESKDQEPLCVVVPHNALCNVSQEGNGEALTTIASNSSPMQRDGGDVLKFDFGAIVNVSGPELHKTSFAAINCVVGDTDNNNVSINLPLPVEPKPLLASTVYLSIEPTAFPSEKEAVILSEPVTDTVVPCIVECRTPEDVELLVPMETFAADQNQPSTAYEVYAAASTGTLHQYVATLEGSISTTHGTSMKETISDLFVAPFIAASRPEPILLDTFAADGKQTSPTDVIPQSESVCTLHLYASNSPSSPTQDIIATTEPLVLAPCIEGMVENSQQHGRQSSNTSDNEAVSEFYSSFILGAPKAHLEIAEVKQSCHDDALHGQSCFKSDHHRIRTMVAFPPLDYKDSLPIEKVLDSQVAAHIEPLESVDVPRIVEATCSMLASAEPMQQQDDQGQQEYTKNEQDDGQQSSKRKSHWYENLLPPLSIVGVIFGVYLWSVVSKSPPTAVPVAITSPIQPEMLEYPGAVGGTGEQPSLELVKKFLEDAEFKSRQLSGELQMLKSIKSRSAESEARRLAVQEELETLTLHQDVLYKWLLDVTGNGGK